MLPKAYIVHQVPKRMRISIPSKQKQTDYFAKIVETLRASHEIDQVKTNPVTGSVVLTYRGDSKMISEYARKQNLFALKKKSKHSHYWASEFFRRIEVLDTKIVQSTDGAFNLASTTAFSFVGLSFLQVYRRQILPVASTLLFDAYILLKSTRLPMPLKARSSRQV